MSTIRALRSHVAAFLKSSRLLPGSAADDRRRMFGDWRASWLEVFSRAWPQDVIAGLTVAAVALPINLALAVSSGLPPATGLVTAVVAGLLASTFGGTPVQVTGPATAINILVLGVVVDYGVAGAAAVALMIGALQLVLAFLRTGRWVRFIPEAVLVGFTTGVGIRFLDQEIPEVLGFDYRVLELAQMIHRPDWLHEVSWLAALSGLFVAFMVVSLRHLTRFPAALVSIALVTFVSNYVGWDVARVGQLPAHFPPPRVPDLTTAQWLGLMGRAVPLALLASVESLLSARAIERMAPQLRRPNLDLELFGQGLANLGAGAMAGMPVTGAIVRGGVNVQSGARTRLAVLVQALVLGLAVLVFSRPLGLIPLAGLSGLLCVIGFRLIELKTLSRLWRTDRWDALAFVVTAAGTVSGQLVIGLLSGGAVCGWAALRRRSRETAERRRQALRAQGVRAVLGRDRALARRNSAADFPAQVTTDGPGWLKNIQAPLEAAATAFVHPSANVVGRVILGEEVHIAAGSSVRADEGAPFFFGPNTNLQDGVVVHALKEKRVRVAGEDWAVYVGRNVSVAHHALLHGPCYVGDDTFVGFKAVVHDAIVGSGCYIGIAAVVVGVDLPDGLFVPHGAVIDSPEKVAGLEPVSDQHRGFNENVVQVNRGLASAYRAALPGGRSLNDDDGGLAEALELSARWKG